MTDGLLVYIYSARPRVRKVLPSALPFVTSIADYFLICTGTSNTHVKTLCDSVEAAVADELGEPLLHREGHRGGTWVLLDFGCLVVHVFTEETRAFYDLERLWNDATPVPIDFAE